MSRRPRVRIRFKYNVDTGEIEEFIIDDNAPNASEGYHDEVARAIATYLGRDPDIEDAGVRLPRVERGVVETPPGEVEKKKPDEEEAARGG